VLSVEALKKEKYGRKRRTFSAGVVFSGRGGH
jgi:hypothetical protein